LTPLVAILTESEIVLRLMAWLTTKFQGAQDVGEKNF
jgi:hypothetical protein